MNVRSAISKATSRLMTLGDGSFETTYMDEKYILTISRLENDKILKFYATASAYKNIISGNFYFVAGKYRFRPCEIDSGYALDFIINMKL